MVNKDDYFQAMRGICIICVILIHCKTGMEFKGNSSLVFNYDYWLIFRQLINFPVASFIFLSGYFVNIGIVGENPSAFIYKRGRRILIPYLLWTSFYSLLNITLGTEINGKTILTYIFAGGAAAPLYYIVVLMQLILITPVIVKMLDQRWLNWVCFLVTPLYLVGMYFYNFCTKGQLPLYQLFFPAWFTFYYLGLYTRKNQIFLLLDFKDNKILKSIFFVIVTLSLSILECYLLLTLDQAFGFAISQLKITSFTYAIAVINLAITLKQYTHKVYSLLIKLGNNSFGIYFIHYFYLIITEKVLDNLPYLGNVLVIYQLITLFLVISLSYFTIEISRKIFGIKVTNVILGF